MKGYIENAFNWLTERPDINFTAGEILALPYSGTRLKQLMANPFGFKRLGRGAERAITLSAVFAVASGSVFTGLAGAPLVLAGGGLVIAAKTVGVVTGKACDLVAERMDRRARGVSHGG